MDSCEKIKKIVIKIGTSSLTGRQRGEPINFQVLNKLATATMEIQKEGIKVIIVSSGAMGLGVAKLGLENIELSLGNHNAHDIVVFKQALTAVGQVELMKAYETVFRNYSQHVGQVLLTHSGLDMKDSNETVCSTIQKLLALDIIPIINANDTVTSAEIEFGDNDSLSARIACAVKADKLYVLTDQEGLYDKDPSSNPDAKLIHKVEKITSEIKAIAGGSSTKVGFGGMKSKIMAAEICSACGIGMHILNVSKIDLIPALTTGKQEQAIGTEFYGS
jgi:glutamate 5-kinase